VAKIAAQLTGRQWLAEVTSLEQAKQAKFAGASALIACGFEGGGLVGEEAGLVLLRRLLPLGLPVHVRGGIGPDSAAAVIAAGAAGVVLEHQLWCCPEFPIEEKLRSKVARFNPTDTKSLGLHFGLRFRVFGQVATRAPKQLLAREAEMLAKHASPADFWAEIARNVSDSPWQTDLKTELLPLGQDAALAAPLAAKYHNTAGVISGIISHVEQVLAALPERFPLQENLGAAKTNGTSLPLHQGPMAQVSDTPAFARAVVDAGSMPWLALGNMPAHVAEDVVWKTGEALEGKPFGAGIIGLDANRYRDAHIEMLGRAAKAFPSMMALVAAGTAEQAMQLESLGVRTYLHTPTPGVLDAALKAGQRRFLLEGAEAGGHIGQIGGLALWQLCAQVLQGFIDRGEVDPSEVVILPAGGLSDAMSAAAVSALFFPLIERGVQFGIQMGTAYLMTREAVETGAITEMYQTVGAASSATVVMGESVGAPTRVLPNLAADSVAAKERDRMTSGVSLKERKEAYEHDNLGGLRAAAKAQKIARVDPERGAIFQQLSWEEQEREGLFHAGQGIALLETTRDIASLHQEVTAGARAWLTNKTVSATTSAATTTQPSAPVSQNTTTNTGGTVTPSTSSRAVISEQRDDDGMYVAIVGIGARLPGALSRGAFWNNVVEGVSAIIEVPEDRWHADLYYSEDRDAPDKTYSKIGGFVTGFEFDRKAFRLPPMVVKQMDLSQTLWLEAAREALDDAGLLDADFNRERCAVILGNAMGGDMRDWSNIRIHYPEFEQALRGVLSQRLSIADQVTVLDQVKQAFMKDRLPITEDTMPGELANVIAGRTAQLFDLGGANFTVDAACASSLAAIESAVRGLLAHRFDTVVTGGVDNVMGPSAFVKFSKIGALSPDGSRPFDEGANGFVMGEGAAALVLKRLEDAERDGDAIYGVIRGIGASSDGRGKAITAPNPIGQERAVRRAYQEAGFGPRSVSLIEAHGTSTPVGDPVEVSSLARVIAEDNSPASADKIGLGSVKSMIGHLKSAAGAASVSKIALALKHKTLPPTINVTTPNPLLEIDQTPLALQLQAEPWEVYDGHKRRAGVSAFGFGGTNFHVVMEEWRGDSATVLVDPSSSTTTTAQNTGSNHTSSVQGSSMATSSAPTWNEGVLAMSAPDAASLRAQAERALQDVKAGGLTAVADRLLPIEHPALPALAQGQERLAIVFESPEELPQRLERAIKALDKGKGWRVLSNQGVLYSGEFTARGRTAMLFPGQGSQYLGMLADLAERYPVVRETFAEADRVMAPVLKRNLSDLIHPDLDKIEKMDAFIALSQTEITQPAVLTVDVALWRLLGQFGITPDVVAGHSLGEYGACVAAGVMTFEEALRTVATRGTEMASATPMNGDCGLMASIPVGATEVEAELEKLQPGYVVCANKNSPKQTIIAGLTEPVKRVVAHFEEQGMQVMLLPVSHAFHSEVVAAASKPLRRHLESIDIKVPHTPILTNVTGGYYPQTVTEIRDQLAHQVAAPVEFIAMVEQMWADGARVFIEVGPKRAQASFVSAILEEREHVSLYSNHPKKGGVRSWLDALATLWLTDSWSAERAQAAASVQTTTSQATASAPAAQAAPAQAASAVAPAAGGSSASREDIAQMLLDVLCEKTGYDADEIETDYELEADLGIDTVKQAEIIAAVRDHYGMERDEDFRLADYPTLDALTDYVVARLGAGEVKQAPTAPAVTPQPVAASMTPSAPAPVAASGAANVNRDEIASMLLDVLCEKTGYDADEIETDYELEADLGIDTVKQAEIIAAVRDHYGMDRDEDFRLADYPTLDALTDYVVARLGAGEVKQAQAAPAAPTITPQPVAARPALASPAAPAPAVASSGSSVSRDEIASMLLDVLCEKTGYDADEIETDYELEADLGIDTVKQAEIIAAVRDHYGMERDEDFRLADYPTLNALTDYVVARLGAGEVKQARSAPAAPAVTPQPVAARIAPASPAAPAPVAASGATNVNRDEIAAMLLDVLCEKTGYDADEIEVDYELEADLGIDTVKQAEIIAAVRDHYGMERDEDFRLADYPTLNALTDYVVTRLGSAPSESAVAQQTPAAPAPAANVAIDAKPAVAARAAAIGATVVNVDEGPVRPVSRHEIPADVSITGASLGLPGLKTLFEEDAIENLFNGQNMIHPLPQSTLDAQATNRITRLYKRPDGSAEMMEVTDPAETIKLAGQAGAFDLPEEWGVPKRMAEAMDKMSQMAFAAGLEALRDARLPLLPRYRETTTGKKITVGWRLPEEIGKRTGVIFASVFSGLDALAEEMTARYTDPEYKFNHRLLTRIISMGHSRFAEYIGATGPNMHVNAACATSTAALGMASDWIRLGRCDRVIVIAGENPSGDEMRDWIASAFLAAGAATTTGKVEEAALPFDRRRHGMIIGMGAVGVVVERDGLPEERGVEPLVDLLDTRFVNSAFHPTRLDIDHIASEVEDMMSGLEERFQIDRAEIARRTVFVSHETYTPARGGSAAAEIATLRKTFGEHANEVVIANVKGFTGHPMGASTEDILAMRVLQRQEVPPIANLEQPDPDLGDLRLSNGGKYEVDYALRFAAGFGSQLAVSLYRYRARQQDRVFHPALEREWLREQTGFEHPVMEVVKRTLRVREARPEERPPAPVETAKPEVAPAPEAAPTPAPVIPRVTETPAPQAPAMKVAKPVPAAANGASVDADRFAPKLVVTEALAATPVDRVELVSKLAKRRVAIVAGPMMAAEWFLKVLLELGADAFIVSDASRRSPLDANAELVDLYDEAALATALKGVDGVLNLTGFGLDSDGPAEVYATARQSFHIARGLIGALGGQPGADHFFITITGMGGRLGLDANSTPLPAAGAAGGVTKSLAREWENATVRVVDIPRASIGNVELAHRVLTEGLEAGNPLEVGCASGVRYVPAFLAASEASEVHTTRTISPQSTILVTGGGKGITAEIACDLAQRFGCNLALVGRTKMTFANPLAEDVAAHKARIKQEVVARGERATPMAIKRGLKGLMSQRTIATNMERMRTAGATVEYFSCDMGEPEDVQRMLAEVQQRFGQIQGVIHGAGVEISRLVEQKDVAEFDMVFLAKAVGGLTMWQALEEKKLDFFVTFSSIAGRFGNFGQTDYAAANEALNKLATRINAVSNTQAISIDWTAWAEVGMASRGSMPDILSSRGIEFLPVEVGAPMVGELLTSGARGEVLAAGALGALGGDVRVASERGMPLVDEVISHTETELIVARVLEIERDRFMRDHVYEGTALMPGVMGLEMMCEAARMLGQGELIELGQVRFERALKLHHNQPQRVLAHARLGGHRGEDRVVNVEVRTQRETKTGRVVEQVHFMGEFVVGSARDAGSLEAMMLDPRATTWCQGPGRAAIYERFFHEGTFQVLDEVAFLNDEAIIGYGRLGSEALSIGREDSDLVSDPLAREAAFQVAGLWGMIYKGMSCLPHGIGAAHSFGRVVPGERFVLRARRAATDPAEHLLAFDRVEVLDERGDLLHVMEDVQMIAHQPLREEERFEQPQQVRWSWLACDAECADRLLNGASFDDVLAAPELAEHDRLISTRRRQEWLSARLASKELARRWARDFLGERVELRDFVVVKNEFGAPSLESARSLAIALPPVTMSHSRGIARAAISAPGEPAPIGVDLEFIEPREPSFAEQYFTEEERALSLNGDAPDTLLTALWCCKESVSKALGLGLKLRPSDMLIEGFGEDGGRGVVVKMNIRREAREALEALGASGLDVRLFLVGEFALAMAHGVDMSEQARPLDDAELAALAALLKHKGMLEAPRSSGGMRRPDELPAWKR
jgi:malonyl CoA-acyl carrier protein transacylase